MEYQIKLKKDMTWLQMQEFRVRLFGWGALFKEAIRMVVLGIAFIPGLIPLIPSLPFIVLHWLSEIQVEIFDKITEALHRPGVRLSQWIASKCLTPLTNWFGLPPWLVDDKKLHITMKQAAEVFTAMGLEFDEFKPPQPKKYEDEIDQNEYEEINF